MESYFTFDWEDTIFLSPVLDWGSVDVDKSVTGEENMTFDTARGDVGFVVDVENSILFAEGEVPEDDKVVGTVKQLLPKDCVDGELESDAELVFFLFANNGINVSIAFLY